MLVLKFGGSSVADAGHIQAAARIVAGHREQGPVTVVVSAMAGVTNALLRVAEDAIAGRDGWRAALGGVEERHREAYRQIANGVPDGFTRPWLALRRELEGMAGVGLLPGTVEAAGEAARISGWGERLILGIFAAALRALGVPAEAISEEPVLLSGTAPWADWADGPLGLPRPSVLATRAWLVPRLSVPLMRGSVPVLPGYIARDPHGRSTTLGRNGSDHSAAVIAAALGAERVYIYSHVAGIYSADPRIVPEARLLPWLTYTEAGAVATLGARVLHPLTVEPAARWGIPLHLRSAERPHAPGTDVLPPRDDPPADGARSWVVAARPLPKDVPYLPPREWRGLVEVSASLLGGTPSGDDHQSPLHAAAQALLTSPVPVLGLNSSRNRLYVAIPGSASVAAQCTLHAALATEVPQEPVAPIAAAG